MNLLEIVETSSRLSGTRSRLDKMALLGEVLGRAPLDEVPFVVSCLSGRLPRGRLGIGYATVQDMRRVERTSEPSLSLGEVDAIFRGSRRCAKAMAWISTRSLRRSFRTGQARSVSGRRAIRVYAVDL